ncbi:DUF6894 family protein [Methylobacterium planeticum]|uniref:DUF6894 domain-containing protein n=1 Tax=Methylobacterium planeticum TaxID=2615211 RepID=A0A6N6MRS2_9HYPH|nr:hypothetical protein [Methylobacterium planeticum]KAB1074425.1 hypothetical protein F6X51_08670 [Methylobacterium planeticum]
MARYFFDVHDLKLSACDHEGTDCADRKSISDEALRALCQIAADQPERYLNQKLRVVVRDAADRIVLTAALDLSTAWHIDHSQAAAA